MNDLETRLRDLLNDEAHRAPATPDPARPVHRARRRQAALVGITAVVVASVAIAGVSGLRSLDRGTTPAATVERTVNGITMTIPEEWWLVDPVEAGIEPDGDGAPRLIAMLSDAPPASVVRCPAEMPASVLLTIQQQPLTLEGEAAAPWPVELEPMPGTADVGCYAGWEFMRAGWTTAGRTLEARVGIGGQAPQGSVHALMAAFASMTFAEVQGSPASIEVASGTAAGEEWRLVATTGSRGPQLMLEHADGASGFEITSDNDLMAHDVVFGEGAETRLLVYGLARDPISRIDMTPVDASRAIASVEVTQLPDEIGADVGAFYLDVADPVFPAKLRGYATDGTLVDEWLFAGNRVEEPAGDVLFRGRTNECLWQIRAEPSASDPESFVLWPQDGGPPTWLTFSRQDDRDPMQLTSFTCPQGGTIVFGTITDEIAEIQWVSPAGPGVREGTGCTREDLLPDDVCFFLSDHGDLDGGGAALGYDSQGREVARVDFG